MRIIFFRKIAKMLLTVDEFIVLENALGRMSESKVDESKSETQKIYEYFAKHTSKAMLRN